MSKYGDDLRRIVGVSDIKKRLTELEDKQKIESGRGVGYQDGTTGQTTSSSGASNSSGGGGHGIQAPNSAFGGSDATATANTSDATKEALKDKANKGGSGAAGSDGSNVPTITPTDGVLDLADIIDNNADKDLIDSGLKNGFKSVLAGISGWTDGTTGYSGLLRFLDDMITPPSDWANAFTPPLATGWVLGTRWVLSGSPSGTIYGATAEMAGEAGAADLNASPPDPTDVPYVFTGNSGSGGSAVANFTRAVNPPFTLPCISVSCTPGFDFACPITNPTAGNFPLDGGFELYKDITGHYVGSIYETQTPDLYKHPTSTVYMDFSSGSRHAVLRAGAGGTTLLYETDSGFAPLTGAQIHIYDSQGGLKGLDNVTNLNAHTP